jgi:hypothetical protein
VKLISPVPNARYGVNDRITAQFDATAHYPILKANYYLNNELVGIATTPPFMLGFIPSSVNALASSTNQFKVVVYDSVYNKTEITVPIIIQ